MAALNTENIPEQTPEPVQTPEPITNEQKRDKLNIAMGNLSKKEMIYLINLLDMQSLPQEQKKHFFFSLNKALVLIKNGKFPIKETTGKGKVKMIPLKKYKGITIRERFMIRDNLAKIFLDKTDPEFRNPFYYDYTDGKKTSYDKKRIIQRIFNTVTNQKRLQMLILHQFRNFVEPFRNFYYNKPKQGGKRKTKKGARKKRKKKTKKRKKRKKKK